MLSDLVQIQYESSRSNAKSTFSTGQNSNCFVIPRQLIYQWGSNPSVSWDWWIDPNSCAYLVREEFKHLDILGPDFEWPWNEWTLSWPLRFPAWSDHFQSYELPSTRSERQPLYDLAQKRANRRWEKKAMKAVRAQGLKKRDRMPGAWPV